MLGGESEAGSGSARPREESSLLRSERGAVMIIGLFMSLGLIALTWFTVGIGRAFLFRERAQEATDTAALFVAIMDARGMNAIAALNVFLLALTYLFMMNRLAEAMLFHALQLIGLPDAGWGPLNGFDYSNRSCAYMKTNFGSGGATLPLTISDSYKQGFDCASTRLPLYNAAAGTSLGAEVPGKILLGHNYLHNWNDGIEAGQRGLYVAIGDAQDKARKDFFDNGRSKAGFMIIDYDWPYSAGGNIGGGLLDYMKMKEAEPVIDQNLDGKLPVETKSDGKKTDRTVNALCIRLSAPMQAPFGVMRTQGETQAWGVDVHDRAWGPLTTNSKTVVVYKGASLDFGEFFTQAAQNDFGSAGTNIWCDSIGGGGAGGQNYWKDVYYAGLRDDVGGRAENGGDWFQVRVSLKSSLDDGVVTKPVGILKSGAAQDPKAVEDYYSQAEFFFDCTGPWSGGDCNGTKAGGAKKNVGTQTDDFALFRTAWVARLKYVDQLPGGVTPNPRLVH